MILADAWFPDDDQFTNTALALEKSKIEFHRIKEVFMSSSDKSLFYNFRSVMMRQAT